MYKDREDKAIKNTLGPANLKAISDKIVLSKRMGLWKIYVEKQFRCGDGTGKISHSINCRCEKLEKEIKSLEKFLKGV